VRQIFIDRPEIFIGHSPDGLPRHLLAKFMAVGIDTGAHGGDEFLKLPSLYKIEVGPERRQLAGHTAGQFVAVAGAAILIRQDISPYCKLGLLGGAVTMPLDSGFPFGSIPAPSIVTPNRLRWSGGLSVCFPAAGKLRS